MTLAPVSRGPSLVRATLRALMVPRRLVPIALVAASLVAAQVSLSRDPLGTPLSLLMVVAFVTLAPLSWRVLFPEGLDLAHGAIRLVLYVIVGAGVVLTLGAVVPKVTGMGETFLTTRPSLIVCGMLFLVGGWALARDIGLEESLDRERRRADLLVKEADQARLLALRTHLDPHFLFNTLNAIAEWCREDGEVAERAVLQLSSMLRTILTGVRSATWPIAKELELLSTLFDLHRMRDPNLFTVTIDVDAEARELAVPPLVLLPLAENAVKHGPAAGHRGEIAVSVTRAGGQATIRISNPGPYRGPREGSEGVPSVTERLQSAFGSAARFDLRAEGERTVAELSLPGGAVP